MRVLCVGFLCLGSFCFADLSLDSLMSKDDQVTTGYSSLTFNQKAALSNWISEHFTVKAKGEDDLLSLSINVQGGKMLILSDGSKWEVAPSDQVISSLWITPFPLTLSKSNSKEYPQELFNLQTKERVRVRPAS